MPLYRVTSTCNAVVRTTYFVEAASAAEARRKVERSDAPADDEEVYGHQAEELEVAVVEPSVPVPPKPKPKKGRA